MLSLWSTFSLHGTQLTIQNFSFSTLKGQKKKKKKMGRETLFKLLDEPGDKRSSTLNSNNGGKMYFISETSDYDSSGDSTLSEFLKQKN